MYRTGNSVAAGLVASLWAGPIFVATLALAQYVRQIPQPVAFPEDYLQIGFGAPILLVPMTIIVGFVLSAVPNVVGAALMADLSDRLESAQSPIAWVAAGTTVGALIAWLFIRNSYYGEPDLLALFPLIATSAICAGLCWRRMGWQESFRRQG